LIDLKNKVMIVTGGSRGIGASICKSAAEQGAKVLVNYVSNSESAASVVSDIEINGGDAIAVKADVTDMSSVQEMVNQALESWSKIDILVNNAAIWNESQIDMMSDAIANEPPVTIITLFFKSIN